MNNGLLYGMKRSIMRKRGRSWGMALLLGLLCSVTVSCSKELTEKDALDKITAQEEFQNPYYAPMRVGEMVLTGNNYKNVDGYIQKHYGQLIQEGLLSVEQADRNSWRTVIDIQLTEKGLAMSDKRRGDQQKAYVAVCQMVPVKIDELRIVTEDKVIECSYTFEEQDITPFGKFLKFQEGRSYTDTRTFVRARGSWHVK